MLVQRFSILVHILYILLMNKYPKSAQILKNAAPTQVLLIFVHILHIFHLFGTIFLCFDSMANSPEPTGTGQLRRATSSQNQPEPASQGESQSARTGQLGRARARPPRHKQLEPTGTGQLRRARSSHSQLEPGITVSHTSKTMIYCSYCLKPVSHLDSLHDTTPHHTTTHHTTAYHSTAHLNIIIYYTSNYTKLNHTILFYTTPD